MQNTMPPFEESHYPIDPDYRQPDGNDAPEQPFVLNFGHSLYPYPERRPHSVYGIFLSPWQYFLPLRFLFFSAFAAILAQRFPKCLSRTLPPWELHLSVWD